MLFALGFVGSFILGGISGVMLAMVPLDIHVTDTYFSVAHINLFISICGFCLGASQLVFLYNMIVSWRWGPRASPNPWGARTIEWLVSSPPPRFNFQTVPRIVGGPYEYGVPGARHAIMDPPAEHVVQ